MGVKDLATVDCYSLGWFGGAPWLRDGPWVKEREAMGFVRRLGTVSGDFARVRKVLVGRRFWGLLRAPDLPVK